VPVPIGLFVALTADTYDPVLEQQVSAARARQARALARREVAARASLLLALVAGAGIIAASAHSRPAPDWWWYPVFAAAYAVLSGVQFEVGNGAALPTELVFVPMLFVLPPAAVPLVVASGLVVASLPAVLRRQLSVTRALSIPASAAFALGPAAVFAATGSPPADLRGGVVLLGALAAQFVCDFGAAALLERIGLGARPSDLLRPLGTTFAIDVLIAPFGFLVAVAMRVEPFAIALPLPLLGLFALLARERTQKLDSLLELSSAYRGTAFLLGDVVEADDAYTGEHSRQVVELTTAVGEAMGLGVRDLRIAELTALLHDVGKIRIPAEIINKPGPLDPEEWAVMKTHTLEGERLLGRVGGLLADVGRIVRSCHERWDGAGYPDGLAGEEIPLVARVVCCCDAYNAMTTDRSYRRAMPAAEALREVQANAGTQFDPAVVSALLGIETSRLAAAPVARPGSRDPSFEGFPTAAPAAHLNG
jgi:HD-GYP domain-containing protein (c-di-GMP phosphodiesterase class II)